ncbi:MAG: hybrid sensor histidine kinase/response regulator transcription factor [Prevotella sp.]|jgi:signal transduction histidine kinase/ligand-binding sensor domain-containing protein/CheY-like chemotaxis protein/AraC-like DNA-binding protein
MMKQLYKYCLWTFLLTVIGNLFVSSQETFDSRSITMENGLRSNTVRTVVQDSRGFIWMGTDEGLCRFDGNCVTCYRNSLTGADQYVSTLKPSANGLLVGTGRGAFFFSYRKETFTRYIPSIKTEVRRFQSDMDGNMWVATMGQGVFCYNSRSHRLKRYPFHSVKGRIHGIGVDADNQIWALCREGSPSVCKLNKSTDKFEDMSRCLGQLVNDAVEILQTREGVLLLGTWEHGLYEIGPTGKATQVFSPQKAAVGRHLHTMVEMPDGNIFMGTDDGVVVFNLHTRSWSRELVPFGSVGNSNSQFVYSILRDREGGLWMGTFYGGVKYFSPMGRRFLSYSNDDHGFAGFVVSHFCEDNYGRVWIASDDGGLSCFSIKLGQVVPYAAQGELSHYNVHALCIDGGDLWVGSYSNGIVRMNLASGALRRYDRADGLDVNSCYAIYKDKRGRLWAATMDGSIFLFQTAADRFSKVYKVGSMVIDIDDDRQGNLWFTSQNDGLYCYVAKSHRWKHYCQASGLLTNDGTNCLEVADDGTIWVGTGGGLLRYMPREDKFRAVTLPQEQQEVNGVVSDQGVLWLATSRGIVRYQPGQTPWTFNKFDGLKSGPFRPNACLKTSDGHILFGGQSGFTVFAPYQISINRKQPPVFITQLQIYNHEQNVGTKRLPESLDAIDQLELYHDDRMFTLSFAALSYCSPEKNQYAYMLEGFDKEWNYVGNQHTATYTNLPAGKYVFRVKATNNDGVWSTHEATLNIYVHPPFWMSTGAKIFYVLVIVGSIYGYVQLRMRKAEKKHREEIAKLNDIKELEIKEARLKFFTMIAHEIRTPLTLIIGPLEQLIAKVEETGVGKEWKDTLLLINKNAHRLLDLVNQLLDFNKVQHSGWKLHFQEAGVADMMRGVAERFQPYLNQRNISFSVDYPPESLTAVFDVEAITKVVSNLMTNAMKYTRNSIRLSAKENEDKLHFSIEVADNGVGISKEEQKKIFDAFYQARDNKPGTGIGLSIVDSIVKQHHGDIKVNSSVGNGSVFVVTLPKYQTETEPSLNDNSEKPAEMKIQETPALLDNESDNGQNLLVVEDDEDLCNFLADNFRKRYSVFTAHNGREALVMLEKNEMSLIVSDWMMPEMDGRALLTAVRGNQRTSHIPFIMLTAKTDDKSKTEGMESGADLYIEKPFAMNYLNACIDNLLRMRRLLIQKFAATPTAPLPKITKSQPDNIFLQKMNAVIEENIDNPDLSVGFLAEHLNISRSGLFAKLKSLADVTPNEMIQIVRLRRAAQLLSEGNYQVNEVCFQVGFNSPSYFAKCFQKQFGIRPGEYRSSQM